MQLLMLLDMQMHVYLPQKQHCYYLANEKFIVPYRGNSNCVQVTLWGNAPQRSVSEA